MLALYTKYNARRTPEMLTADTYSALHYREADRVVAEYQTLAERARTLFKKIPATHHAAFQQLVLFPIEACANVTEMYVAAGKNETHGLRGTASANFFADRVRELFDRDAELTRRFHAEVAGGKWNHMMSQTHIGYASWNHPPLNRMPPVSYVQTGNKAELGFFVEHGSRPKWGWLDVEADWSFTHELPTFDPINDQDFTIEVFNRGREPLSYTLTPRQDWIRLSKKSGTIRFDERVNVTIDWAKAPSGRTKGEVVVAGAGNEYVVTVPIRNERPAKAAGFMADNGVVSIEASRFHRSTAQNDARWITVPNLGRTGSSVTISPAGAATRKAGTQSPYLEYTFTLWDETSVNVETHVSPNAQFPAGRRFAFRHRDRRSTASDR